MSKEKILIEPIQGDSDVCYVYLQEHSKLKSGEIKAGETSKQLRLLNLIPDYKGPDIFLDFNNEGILIGLEFLF